MDDLDTSIGLRRRSGRCHSPSPRRCLDSPLCSPCPPRCYSSSPSVRRRRITTRCKVPQRDLKSGRMICDKFSSVCYPRNLSKYCNDYDDVCPPRYRKPVSCTPSSCYRSCTPPRCPRGTCRTSCRCLAPPPPPSYCPPCSPCGDDCEPEPSDRFVQAMKNTGPCTSRYQTHLCPWEADVTVSGTIRAHCTSTADEISNRLAGPFKAFGKRFTTDTECNWPSCEPCYDQKLSLGMLDDGGCLDFSRNNRLNSDSSSLDYRVKRIVDRDRKAPFKSRPLKDNHISWDRSVDRNHSHDDGATRYTGRYNHRDKQSNIRGRRNNYSYQDDMDLRRHINYRSYAERRRTDTSGDDDVMHFNRHRDDSILKDRRRSTDMHQSDFRCSEGEKRPVRSPSFEIMMNRRLLDSKRRYRYGSSNRARHNQNTGESKYEETHNSRRNKGYESGVESDDEEKLSLRYRSKQRAGFQARDASKTHYGYQDRDVKNERRQRDKDYRFDNKASYYNRDFNTSKHNASYSTSGTSASKHRSLKDLAELDRIRFWPCDDDTE